MGWVVNATLRPLYPRERPDTHCIGSWVGPRAGLDGCGKFHPPPPPGFDPQTVQPVASRCTDRALPAPVLHWKMLKFEMLRLESPVKMHISGVHPAH